MSVCLKERNVLKNGHSGHYAEAILNSFRKSMFGHAVWSKWVFPNSPKFLAENSSDLRQKTKPPSP